MGNLRLNKRAKKLAKHKLKRKGKKMVQQKTQVRLDVNDLQGLKCINPDCDGAVFHAVERALFLPATHPNNPTGTMQVVWESKKICAKCGTPFGITPDSLTYQLLKPLNYVKNIYTVDKNGEADEEKKPVSDDYANDVADGDLPPETA